MAKQAKAVSEVASFSSPGLLKAIIRLGLASVEQVAAAEASRNDKKVIAALAAIGVSEEEILAKLGTDLGIQRIDLRNAKILEGIRKAGFLTGIDPLLLRRHRCLPVRMDGDRVFVAVADPLDMEMISQLEFGLGGHVTTILAKESEILQAIERLVGLHETDNVEFGEARPSGEQDGELDVGMGGFSESTSEEAGSAAAPIVRFVNRIFSEAHGHKASDIHFEPTTSALEVRYRIDGVMSKQLSIPKRVQPYIITRIKLLSGMDITEKRRPQDGRFRMRPGSEGAIDVRVSSVPTPLGEKLVLRLLRSDIRELNIACLAMPPELESRFRQLLTATDRILLVTGPTGSGKTTTLYSSLNEIANDDLNIITVEDPIEIRLDGITQMQVDPKVEMTFANGMRSILRQDPDVILVGEIRDLETAEIAFQAAQTGHFVLSTLHTNTAPSAVTRLLDLGAQPFVVAASLGAVLAQRLIRRLCRHCIVDVDSDTAERLWKRFGIQPGNAKTAKGCEHCENTGYRGRIGVYSLLVVDQEIRDLIRQRASEDAIEAAAKQNGLEDLFDAALAHVRAGVTSIEEVERNISSPLPPTGRAHPTTAVLPTKESARSAVNTTSHTSLKDLAQAYRPETGPAENAKILLIDDDEGIRAVMSRILRRADYEVCEAGNGIEALEKLNGFQPHLVICDLMMPGMDGREVVTALRGNDTTKYLPVLMLTGSDSEENEIDLITAGANDFVSKTASPALVIARIQRLLSH